MILIPARINRVVTLDTNELRIVELSLPSRFEIENTPYPVLDHLRPGTAFVAEPFGFRTRECKLRVYTRSNIAVTEPLILQTIINDTHKKCPKTGEETSDTSRWWQTGEVKVGDTVRIRADLSPDRKALIVREHTTKAVEKNLILPAELGNGWEWVGKSFLALSFSTGITPFLAHIRYMAHYEFGGGGSWTNYILVASVRYPRQLMFHDELLEIKLRFPDNFLYHPVLTREWPEDWSYGRGRIFTYSDKNVFLNKLLAVVPDFDERHVMVCGGERPLEDLRKGMDMNNRKPLSLRAEVW